MSHGLCQVLMKTNIYAQTLATPPSGYPAFISVNVAGGEVEILVRSPDSANCSRIVLTRQEAWALAMALEAV